MTYRFISLAIKGAVASVLLAGCGHPVPGPNAGAADASPTPPPLASQPTVGAELGAVAANKVEVPFPLGGSELTNDGDARLDLAARLFRDANPVLMFVSGHADATGDEYANLLISAKRAEAVKRGLVARGIPASRLLLQAYGVSEPVDSSQPQAPDNRRVVITWRLL